MVMILGIHGLANKPPEETLHRWWLKSVKEGLKKNENDPDREVPFDIVYWADALYVNCLHQKKDYPFDALYNRQPYKAAKQGALQPRGETSWTKLRDRVSRVAGRVSDVLAGLSVLDEAGDWVVKRVSLTRDLHLYYEDPRIRKTVQNSLRKKLEQHNDRPMMLIAHSMGSIVAYDVLRDIGHDQRKKGKTSKWRGFECPYFVTIGCPLGLARVKDHIVEQRRYDPQSDRLRTPTIVTESWVNFADPADPVALDSHLRDDYKANRHEVQVVDDLVTNDYTYGNGQQNPHKSYGYLRTPEMSRHISEFLDTA